MLVLKVLLDPKAWPVLLALLVRPDLLARLDRLEPSAQKAILALPAQQGLRVLKGLKAPPA